MVRYRDIERDGGIPQHPPLQHVDANALTCALFFGGMLTPWGLTIAMLRVLLQIPLSAFTQRKEKKAAPAEPDREISDAELPKEAAPVPKKKRGAPK